MGKRDKVVKDHQIICGDALEVLPNLPRAQMIFADPPDNIGLKYDGGNGDKLSVADYRKWLSHSIAKAVALAPVQWWSINAQHADWASLFIHSFFRCTGGVAKYVERRFIWCFTFGQHRETDCGNNYRPIFRVAPKDFKWHTDRIRIPSERQRRGDKRANPKGRVPGDVWGGPADIPGLCRIQGNNKERRKWHPTQHPEKLIERMVLMSTDEGDLIIDPFLGTGTTMRVCQRLNRRCIGIDISKIYCQKVSEETGVPIIE